jgi:hypothetical protein
MLLFLIIGWGAMGFIALLQLERHGRSIEGFAWGVFFGLLGVLISVIVAGNLDRDKSDKETRDLLRQDITRLRSP